MNSPTRTAHAANLPANLGLLRFFCLLEAATLLALLFIAMPLKYLLGYPLAVSVAGPVHGFVFLIFAWQVAQSIGAGHIRWRKAGELIVAAVLPFGGIYSWWTLR